MNGAPAIPANPVTSNDKQAKFEAFMTAMTTAYIEALLRDAGEKQ